MIKRMFFLLGIIVLSVMSNGCASGPKPASEPLVAPNQLSYEELNTDQRFRKYASVGIRPFYTEGVDFLSTNADEKPEMEGFKRHAADDLIKGFTSEMKKIYYTKYGVIENDADASKYDLVISGKFMEFDRGNRASRYLTGKGWTSVRVSGAMTETATGKEICRFKDVKYGKGGSFGGDSMDLLKDNCEELGGNLSDFLRDVY